MNQEYSEYINGDDWKSKRLEKLNSVGRKCESCGSNSRLDVHHLTYERFRNENMDDLMVLCRKHHEVVESGYRSGKLLKRGCVASLRSKTIEFIDSFETVALEPVISRRAMVRLLFEDATYLQILKADRSVAKKQIRKLARRGESSDAPKRYTNMLMTYDAFHGIGGYNKFRKEVLEVYESMGFQSTSYEAVSKPIVPLESGIVEDIEKLCGSIRNYAKKRQFPLALQKAALLIHRLTYELESGQTPTRT